MSLGWEVGGTSQGNIYTTGAFNDVVELEGTRLESHGREDIFVLSLDSQGELRHLWSAGGASGDVGSGVAVSADGAVFVTGFFKEEVQLGDETHTSAGDSDIFVLRLEPP